MQPETLNRALLAYVCTFTNDLRLKAHLQAYSASEAAEIDSLVKAVVQSAEDYLWTRTCGVKLPAKFEAAFSKHLKDLYPWLNQEALSRLFSFTKWVSWHVGLGKESAKRPDPANSNPKGSQSAGSGLSV